MSCHTADRTSSRRTDTSVRRANNAERYKHQRRNPPICVRRTNVLCICREPIETRAERKKQNEHEKQIGAYVARAVTAARIRSTAGTLRSSRIAQSEPKIVPIANNIPNQINDYCY
jgi:hypothetical protein